MTIPIAAGWQAGVPSAPQPGTDDTPARANLRRLAVLRLVALVGLGTLAWTLRGALGLAVSAQGLLLSGVAVLLLSVATLWRCGQPWPVRSHELALHLALDILALSAVFQASSGAANPFVSLYLVPVVVAATTLPRVQVWLLAALACAGYSALLLEYAPLLSHHHHPGAPAEFDLHVVGMWGNFVLSTAIIGVAVVNMGAALRAREAHLALVRENMLRNEQILGLATLAAGAAHELGTPLSTLAVLSRELELECADRPDLQEDFRLVRAQVAACKEIIQRMLARNAATEGGTHEPVSLQVYLESVLDQWRLMRPRTALGWQPGNLGAQTPAVRQDVSLAQAVISVLNNAADASPHGITVEAQLDQAVLRLRVLDEGKGVDSLVARQLGRAWVTSKDGQGRGLGLFLTNATLERLGGTVRLSNRPEGGACTLIELPLRSIEARP